VELPKCYPKGVDETREKCWELAGHQMEEAKKGQESKDRREKSTE